MSEPFNGPYEIRLNNGTWGDTDECPLVIKSEGFTLAAVVAAGIDEYRANARLFASSWELREIVKLVHKAVGDVQASKIIDPEERERVHQLWKRMDAALAFIADGDVP